MTIILEVLLAYDPDFNPEDLALLDLSPGSTNVELEIS